MAKTPALSDEKARLIAQTEAQREQLARQCGNLQFAAALAERGHQIAFTAFQARKKLSPWQSVFSKKSWISIPGFFQNAQTILGLVQSFRANRCQAEMEQEYYESSRRF